MVYKCDSHICGTTTVGERGQVVIPSEIRKRLKLKTGDKMMVFCKMDKVVGFVKADSFDEFIDSMTNEMTKKMQALKKKFKNKEK